MIFLSPKSHPIIPSPPNKLSMIRYQSLVLTGITLCLFSISGCSYHYRQGQKLEKKERWEEASIEYHLAFIDHPDDSESKAAMERTYQKVAQENIVRYQDYLKAREYRKAYARLEAALLQDPSNEVAQKEKLYWTKVLVAGQVDFEFDRIRSSIRLTDTMQFEVDLNTPLGSILKAPVDSSSGFFFVEDLLYRQDARQLALYSLNMVGLALTKKGPDQESRDTFKRFISFRVLSPTAIQGDLEEISSSEVKGVAEHRQSLVSQDPTESLWIPPTQITYRLSLSNQGIGVTTPLNRIDFLPNVLYLNRSSQRAFVDFGHYTLQLDAETDQWSLRKESYLQTKDDPFYQLSKNLALVPYFFTKKEPMFID